MENDSGIDPRLRDSLQSSQAASSEQPPAFETESSPARLPPPTSQASYPSQHHPAHLQPYQHWPQDGYPAYPAPQPHQHLPPGSPPPGYQGQHGPPGNASSAPQYVASHLADAKRLRACEACRGLKVRCEPDPNGGPCKRCLKTRKQCMITAPTRKRQKKTDSRVAELEKKIDALTHQSALLSASLSGNRDGQHSSDSHHGSYAQDTTMDYEMSNRQDMNHSAYPSQPQQNPHAPPADLSVRPLTEDDQFRRALSIPQGPREAHMYDALEPVVDGRPSRSYSQKQQDLQTYNPVPSSRYQKLDSIRDSIDAKLAASLFAHYSDDMMPLMPLVYFPPDLTVDQLRKSYPILFGAVMWLASADQAMDLHRTLDKATKEDVVERIFVNNEKSAELALCLLLLAVWHEEAANFRVHQFYTQTAFSMAVEIDADNVSALERDEFDLSSTQRSSPLLSGDMANIRIWAGCCYALGLTKKGTAYLNPEQISGSIKTIYFALVPSNVRFPGDQVLDNLVLVRKQRDDLTLSTKSHSEQSSQPIISKIEGLVGASSKSPLSLMAEVDKFLSSTLAIKNLLSLAHSHNSGNALRSQKRKREDPEVEFSRLKKDIYDCCDKCLKACIDLLKTQQHRTSTLMPCFPPVLLLRLAGMATAYVQLSLACAFNFTSDPQRWELVKMEPSTVASNLNSLIEASEKYLTIETYASSPSLAMNRVDAFVKFLRLLQSEHDNVYTKTTKNHTSSTSPTAASERKPESSAVHDESADNTGKSRALHLLSEVATGTTQEGRAAAAATTSSAEETAAAAVQQYLQESAGGPSAAHPPSSRSVHNGSRDSSGGGNGGNKGTSKAKMIILVARITNGPGGFGTIEDDEIEEILVSLMGDRDHSDGNGNGNGV